MQNAAVNYPESALPFTNLPDERLVDLILGGNTELFAILMRRYNQRLYRVSLSIVGNAGEAEDIVQETYLRAFQKLEQFEGRAAFSTWLTKIAIHESLTRRRKRKRLVDLDPDESATASDRQVSHQPGPELLTYSTELRKRLENAVLAMPDNYREVFVLRKVQGLSIAQTGTILRLSRAAVKTRLHRALNWLKKELSSDPEFSPQGAFRFAGQRCAHLVQRVMSRLSLPETVNNSPNQS